MVITDQEFIRLKNRDKLLLTRLYETYKMTVSTYFYIKTFGNRAMADDLTHETFCAVIESVPKLQNSKNIKYWVLTIARNKLVEYQRRLYRNKKYCRMIGEESLIPDDMFEKIHTKQKALLLNLAIAALNTQYKAIYHMRFIEEKSLKEIAAHFKITDKAVDNILGRIKMNLRKAMKKLAKNFF